MSSALETTAPLLRPTDDVDYAPFFEVVDVLPSSVTFSWGAIASSRQAFESIFDKNSAILDVPLELFDENRPDPTVPGSTQTEMPVFMLDVAACPGGVVPLHIFEMRYRQVRRFSEGSLLPLAAL